MGLLSDKSLVKEARSLRRWLQIGVASLACLAILSQGLPASNRALAVLCEEAPSAPHDDGSESDAEAGCTVARHSGPSRLVSGADSGRTCCLPHFNDRGGSWSLVHNNHFMSVLQPRVMPLRC